VRLGPSGGLYAAVAAGGIVGGVLRVLVLAIWPATGGFPLALLTINSAGAGMIGLVLAFSEPGGRRRLPPPLAVGLMAGFCGSLTTFSAFAVASLTLLENPAQAAWYVVVSLTCWLVAAALGLWAGRRMNRAGSSGPCNM